MNDVQWTDIGFGVTMLALGMVAGTILSFRRVDQFIARIQAQLAEKGNFVIKVSPWYKLRVMFLGVPKK